MAGSQRVTFLNFILEWTVKIERTSELLINKIEKYIRIWGHMEGRNVTGRNPTTHPFSRRANKQGLNMTMYTTIEKRFSWKEHTQIGNFIIILYVNYVIDLLRTTSYTMLRILYECNTLCNEKIKFINRLSNSNFYLLFICLVRQNNIVSLIKLLYSCKLDSCQMSQCYFNNIFIWDNL